MLIIFDLDYTLLDTTKFKRGLGKALGLSMEEFNDTYKKIFKDKKLPYNIDIHIKYLLQNFREGLADSTAMENGIKSRIKEFLRDIDQYLFHEAENVLKKMKEEGHSLLLLTYGDEDWQRYKIENLKIKKYFDGIFYADKDKYEVLEDLVNNQKQFFFPGDEILIVNDNAQESLRIKESLGRGEIFLLEGPYSNNCAHDLKARDLRELID